MSAAAERVAPRCEASCSTGNEHEAPLGQGEGSCPLPALLSVTYDYSG